MALEARLYQRLSQQLVMTPQLRQAIKILQVSRLELEQLVDQELVENPVLEEGVEQRDEEEEEKKPRTEERQEPKGEGGDDLAEAGDDSQTTTEIEPEKPLTAIDWEEHRETYNHDCHGSAPPSAAYGDERRPRRGEQPVP